MCRSTARSAAGHHKPAKGQRAKHHLTTCSHLVHQIHHRRFQRHNWRLCSWTSVSPHDKLALKS